MMNLSDMLAGRRARLSLLIGLCGLGGWLLASLAVSDFDLVSLQTMQRSLVNGKITVDTEYNALGVFGLAVPLVTLLGGAALYFARPMIELAWTLMKGPGGRVASKSAMFERELAGVLDLVRANAATTETYATALAGAQTRLSGLSEPQQVRVAVSLLVAENERMHRESKDFQTKIEARAREIEALRSNLDGVEKVALKDPLTGTGNRRQFDLAMKAALRDNREMRTPVSLIMCDIDHFKKINDAFGHQVGDEIIKMLARVIRSAIRETDTVVRYGGEEFAVILPRTGQEGARAIAERIRNQFGAKTLTVRETDQQIGQVTASFGVAQYRPGESVDALIERADSKLYEAKTSGRNRVVRA